jgi:galactokinase
MITKKQLQKHFTYIYQTSPTHYFFSPGRLNLIGEHIDYHGGMVMPGAIQLGTYAAVSIREDQHVFCYSDTFKKDSVLSFSFHSKASQGSYIPYIQGIFETLLKKGYHIPYGINLYLESDLPTASGLSSSASLEILIIYLLNELFDLQLNRASMARLSQQAEQEFLGVQSGMMDQLSIACGKKNHALFMNTSTLDIQYVPLELFDYALIIMNTNYQRTLKDSQYNKRVEETREASLRISKDIPHHHLTELKSDQLDHIETIVNDDVLMRRVRHVVLEQQRTIDAKKALEQKDFYTLGKLLYASHVSLKHDYEVTGIHLDTIVEAAMTYAIGARMTGAGFGGCALALVKKTLVKKMKDHVTNVYQEKTNLKPSFYEVSFEAGVHER